MFSKYWAIIIELDPLFAEAVASNSRKRKQKQHH